MIFMEQIYKCEYSSLSCFLQLSDIDTNDKKPTTPGDAIFRDISVLNLYYEILRKVEKDPFKYWNIYALRNYLWYFYKLSKHMSDSILGFSERPKSDHKLTPLNIYADLNLAIFFTGLYRKDRNEACIEGLFIVCQRQDENNINRSVKTYSQLRDSDLKKYLDDLTVTSTVKDYFKFLSWAPEKIEKIEGLSEIDNNTTYDKYKGKYIDTRLHILIDGVDNIPLDYMRILYGIKPNDMISCGKKKKKDMISSGKKKKYTKVEDTVSYSVEDIVSYSVKDNLEQFKNYQKAMIDAINKAILKAEEYKFNHLPLNFFSNNSEELENPFQYLLPIDFTGTGNPDFCACISVDAKGTGRLKTILNMNEVYGNVRVFGMDAVESVKDWWV